MTKELKKITTVISRGREFYICYNKEAGMVCGKPQHYWGIDSKLFGSDGHLTKEINGIEGHLSATVAECVEQVRQTIEIEYIKESTGCDLMKAIEIYFTQKMAQ